MTINFFKQKLKRKISDKFGENIISDFRNID